MSLAFVRRVNYNAHEHQIIRLITILLETLEIRKYL
jgi:hypothetical protein